MNRVDDVVSASEIAQWAFCPESWRLSSVGHEPENRAAIEKGQRHHANFASFEEISRSLLRWSSYFLLLIENPPNRGPGKP